MVAGQDGQGLLEEEKKMTIQLSTLREKFTASLTARGYTMSETKRHHVFTRDGDPELLVRRA